MIHQIEPEPDEPTRQAILAALAQDDTEESDPSPWARQLLPERDGDAA